MDAAISRAEGLHAAGIAVTYKSNRRFWASDWETRGYRIRANLCQVEAELLAIWQAHALVQHTLGIPHKETSDRCTLTVVYTDCIRALWELERSEPILTARMILDRTQQLRRHGVDLELHWCPEHRKVPGNELADLVAKRALRYSMKHDFISVDQLYDQKQRINQLIA